MKTKEEMKANTCPVCAGKHFTAGLADLVQVLDVLYSDSVYVLSAYRCQNCGFELLLPDLMERTQPDEEFTLSEHHRKLVFKELEKSMELRTIDSSLSEKSHFRVGFVSCYQYMVQNSQAVLAKTKRKREKTVPKVAESIEFEVSVNPFTQKINVAAVEGAVLYERTLFYEETDQWIEFSAGASDYTLHLLYDGELSVEIYPIENGRAVLDKAMTVELSIKLKG